MISKCILRHIFESNPKITSKKAFISIENLTTYFILSNNYWSALKKMNYILLKYIQIIPMSIYLSAPTEQKEYVHSSRNLKVKYE